MAEVTAVSEVVKVCCVVPVTQPTGLEVLPWVAITALVEARRTSK